jgi:hypothetical protein
LNFLLFGVGSKFDRNNCKKENFAVDMEPEGEYITIRRTEYEFLVNTVKVLQQEVLNLRGRVIELEGILSKTSRGAIMRKKTVNKKRLPGWPLKSKSTFPVCPSAYLPMGSIQTKRFSTSAGTLKSIPFSQEQLSVFLSD